MAPSRRSRRRRTRSRLSRTLECTPSAAMTRSAGSRRPSASSERPRGIGGDADGRQRDLGARPGGRARERLDHLAPAHGEDAVLGARARQDGVDHPVPGVAGLAHHERRAARHRLVVGADGLQHAHQVVPGEDRGAVRAHVIGALVDAHRPPALGERGGGDEPGDAAARDLRVALRGRSRSLPLLLLDGAQHHRGRRLVGRGLPVGDGAADPVDVHAAPQEEPGRLVVGELDSPDCRSSAAPRCRGSCGPSR